MQIETDILSRMEDFSSFKSNFELYAKETARKAVLFPKFSLPRLRDAHFGWREDLARITEREKNLGRGADHFKQCGHLAYWLRRRSPVVEYLDLNSEYEGDGFLYDKEKKLREILAPYGSEYLAFDFGFQICMFYECNKRKVTPDEMNIPITENYIVDVCHIFKFKNVSPHSINMLYRTIFLR